MCEATSSQCTQSSLFVDFIFFLNEAVQAEISRALARLLNEARSGLRIMHEVHISERLASGARASARALLIVKLNKCFTFGTGKKETL